MVSVKVSQAQQAASQAQQLAASQAQAHQVAAGHLMSAAAHSQHMGAAQVGGCDYEAKFR